MDQGIWSRRVPRRARSRRGSPGYVTLKQMGVLCGVLLFFGWLLLWPITQQHRGCSHSSCISNINQLGKAVLMYQLDWDQSYPRACVWHESVLPYTKNEAVFICPRRPETPGYAFNFLLDGVPRKAVRDRDLQPVIFESDRGTRNATDRMVSLISPHSGGSNVGFADGHTKYFLTPPPADAGLRRRKPSRTRR